MIDKVISHGYCIGCGACAGVAPGRHKMALDENGLLQAAQSGHPDAEADALASQVCPFSNDSLDEDKLAAEFLPHASRRHPKIGNHIKCYVGRVAEDSVFLKSSSGGIGRWLLGELMARNEVDRVIHVAERNTEKAGFPLYKFAIATTKEEVLATAKSSYYPVEMSEMIQYVIANPGRYAITGVPCFIKAIRNISKINKQFRERVRFTFGLVCGHLKSSFYSEMIGWQLGIEPDNLRALDFRVKIPGKRANEKGVFGLSADPSALPIRPKTVQQLFGTNYGHGYFKYQACDYCDDVVSETADVSIGDAWLPEYKGSGTSLVIVRDKRIAKIIEQAAKSSAVRLEEISADRAAESQAGGFRHRRDGLAYRLLLKDERREWRPEKRVSPGKRHLSSRQRKVFRLRQLLSSKSFEYFRKAKEEKNWQVFYQNMSKINWSYHRTYKGRLKTSRPYRFLFRLKKKFFSSKQKASPLLNLRSR